MKTRWPRPRTSAVRGSGFVSSRIASTVSSWAKRYGVNPRGTVPGTGFRMTEWPGFSGSSCCAASRGPDAMFGMYSIAVCCFRCPHPVAANATARAARSPRRTRRAKRDRSATDHPHVHGLRGAEELDRALLVPGGPGVRNEEAEAVVGQVAIEDRNLEIRQTPGDQKHRQGHGAAEQHARLQRDREES